MNVKLFIFEEHLQQKLSFKFQCTKMHGKMYNYKNVST